MKKRDKLSSFKGKATFTKRCVPVWARFFQRFGLFKKVGEIISVNSYSNVFCNAGKYTILERMGGTDAKTGIITYLALGSGTTTPANTDTKLETETYRHPTTTGNRTELVVCISTFIPTDEANDTHKEMGLFGDDASDTADSGTLYTHVAIDETKSSGESITINYDLESL